MREPRKLWEAYQLGKHNGVRPSAIYGVKPKITAFFFDRAVYTFGTTLEERLRKVAEGQKGQKAAERKAMMELNKWLNSGPTAVKTKGRFRDPMAGMSRHA